MLLASLIILYWATSSARSHDLTDPSALDRVKRDLPYETRDRAEKSMEVAKEALSIFNKVMASKAKESLTDWMQRLAKVASIAPGVGSAISAVVNCVLVFISEENPVLDEVKKGFAEVNQKLDSLSIQISNLATDVEWYNYASVYSQDEVCILGTWKKFNEFFKKRGSNDFNYLAEAFVSYYEYTQTEACVANLYHYLTVKDTSLSRNINDMLMRKFQCSSEIGKYNFYFNSLLLKGTVLNKVYWKLTGFNAAGKDAEHAQMFKKVFENQLAALQVCETKYIEYASNTVKEMAKSLRADNKQEFANQVRQTLDEKFSWYNWVVFVYDTKEKDAGNIKVFDVAKISIGDVTVALDQTLKGNQHHSSMEYYSGRCFTEDRQCKLPCVASHEYDSTSTIYHLTDFGKIPYATYKEGLVTVAPSPSLERTCKLDGSRYKLSLYDSPKLDVCATNPCRNNGICRVLLKSNDRLCECPTGYTGNECEKSIDTRLAEEMQTAFPLPVIRSTSQKLKTMESKLDKVFTLITSQDFCRKLSD